MRTDTKRVGTDMGLRMDKDNLVLLQLRTRVLRPARLGVRRSSNSHLGHIRIILPPIISILCSIISLPHLSGTRRRLHLHLRPPSIRCHITSLRIPSTRNTRLQDPRPVGRRTICSRISTIISTSTNRITPNRSHGKVVIRQDTVMLHLCNPPTHPHTRTHTGSHPVNNLLPLPRLNSHSNRRPRRQGVLHQEDQDGIPLRSNNSSILGLDRRMDSKDITSRIRRSMHHSGEASMPVVSQRNLSKEGITIRRRRRLDLEWARRGRVMRGWEHRDRVLRLRLCRVMLEEREEVGLQEGPEEQERV